MYSLLFTLIQKKNLKKDKKGNCFDDSWCITLVIKRKKPFGKGSFFHGKNNHNIYSQIKNENFVFQFH